MKVLKQGDFIGVTWEALDDLGMIVETGKTVTQNGITYMLIDTVAPYPPLVERYPHALDLLRNFGWVIE